MTRRRLVGAAIGIAAIAGNAGAQGTVGGLGLGYPVGMGSARVRATAGALGEFDAQSPLNPASVALWERPGIYAQYDPEYRRTWTNDGEDWVRLARFPVAMLGIRVREGSMVGVSYATMLDRRWVTSFPREELVSGTPVRYSEVTRAEGSLTDLRVGYGWARGRRLALGAAFHTVTGDSRFSLTRDYETTGFGTFAVVEDRSYAGLAASAGAQFRPVRQVALAASWRKGFRLRSYEGDSVVASARVPDRIAGAARYDGIGGLSLAASAAWIGWSALGEMLSASTKAHDGLELSVGAEARGPKWFETTLPLRAGIRTRTLPFSQGSADDPIREMTVGFGTGLLLARGRASLDLGSEYARRTFGDVNERTWTFSFGLTLRQ